MNYSLSVAAKAKHFAIGEDGFYRPVEPCTVCSQNTSEPQCILCDSLRLDPHQIPAGKLGETPFSYEQVIDAVRRQTPSSSPQDIKKWEEIRDEIEARN